jgi:hypothetical protein
MNCNRNILLVLALALGIVVWCVGKVHDLQAQIGQLSTPLRVAAAAARNPETSPARLAARLEHLEAVAPSPGLYMSAVQLHFAKLYFAAEARNWELARFARVEMVENLDVVAALRPEENQMNLAGVIEAFKNTQLEALKEAIDMKDRALFREAYRETVNMCNGCHEALGRSFIHITIPSGPPVPNQLWAPRVEAASENDAEPHLKK